MTSQNTTITAKKIIGALYSPVSSMSALALFIIAGSRLSYAIVAACSLFWVFMLGSFINTFIRSITSKTRRIMLNVMIASFAGSLYYLLLYLLNPLLAMETTVICALSPVFFMSGNFMSDGFLTTPGDRPSLEIVRNAALEPLSLGGTMLVFSLIREPLGFATLSIPGGTRGIIELFNSAGLNPYTVQLITNSTGALFLLAYILIALRYIGLDLPHNSTVGTKNDK
jgi:hypothetical protein